MRLSEPWKLARRQRSDVAFLFGWNIDRHAAAVSDISQSYSYNGVTGHTSHTAGSDFVDRVDNCDIAGEQQGESACVTVDVPPEEERDI